MVERCRAGDPRCLTEYRRLLLELEVSFAAGSPLRDLPVRIMEELLHSIDPAALQAEVDAAPHMELVPREEVESGSLASDGGGVTVEAVRATELDEPQISSECENNAGGRLLTPKVIALVQELLCHESSVLRDQSQQQVNNEPAQSWRGILFVTRRISCWALQRLLSTLPCCRAFLRPEPITGVQQRADGGGARQQEATLRAFRQGPVNLLVATAVVEEGIDVKRCQLVLRFDLPPTAQSYIQSRGRARMQNSQLVLMVDAGAPEETLLVRHMVEFEGKLRKQVLRNLYRAKEQEAEMEASEGRILEGDTGTNGESSANRMENADSEDEELEDADGLYYSVAATGAMAGPANVLQLLHDFIAKLPSDRWVERNEFDRVGIR